MKIKSRVWYWLAAASGAVSLLYGMGIEGGAQLGSSISDIQFATALCLCRFDLSADGAVHAAAFTLESCRITAFWQAGRYECGDCGESAFVSADAGTIHGMAGD